MPGKFLYFFLAISLLLTAACSSTYFTYSRERNSIGQPGATENLSHTGRNKYPPYQGEVKVFRSKTELKGVKYESLGLIQSSRAAAAQNGDPELLVDLCTQAANLGANAVLIVDEDKHGDEVYRVKGQAIRLLD
ncbi:MAG TPA: hypothetical protein VJ417_12710 [Candidatus Glassbacteria bacterium]|nr:hypothetical protein [Candidatus Glassbacteria bacterium]